MSKNFFLKLVAFLLVLATVSLVGYEVGVLGERERAARLQPSYVIDNTLDKPNQVDFSIFWEAWNKVSQNYLEKDKIDFQKMVYGATAGMVESLGDPYTSFFTPTETTSFNEELSGEYQGVGMVVGIKDGQVTVVSPFKGSPADRAGLRSGDKIFKIDDTFTKDQSIEEAVKIIKGPANTIVRLLILRGDWKEPKEFAIKRENIKIPTLEKEINKDNIAIIKIYQFNSILPSEFRKAAQEILATPAVKKIIIDLRNNPGGFLEVAQEVAGWFLPKGQVVTWQDWGGGQEKKAYKSEGPSNFEKYQVVVLMNNGSASASEIMAGALRDQLGAKLIGEKSFGKGLVQEQINLSDKSSLKVTISRWLTPKGVSINKDGLTPDIEVKEATTTTDGADAPMQKAIEFLSNLP
ncbi:MAG: S41 family peptidase [Candidatus Gribaldobacteria bacterium]|nr:S41 family peptidase [Candidatus Gribaldobacteria bacterium]